MRERNAQSDRDYWRHESAATATFSIITAAADEFIDDLTHGGVAPTACALNALYTFMESRKCGRNLTSQFTSNSTRLVTVRHSSEECLPDLKATIKCLTQLRRRSVGTALECWPTATY